MAAVRAMHNVLGGTIDPHASYLLLRGMKTLDLRVERQNRTALEVARRLEAHPLVTRVHYPGEAGGPARWRAGHKGAMGARPAVRGRCCWGSAPGLLHLAALGAPALPAAAARWGARSRPRQGPDDVPN